MPLESDPAVKRLLWRCRRGTKELDVILSRFVEFHYTGLTHQEKQWFESLLEVQDPVLNDWLCNQIKPQDQGMVKIVEKILSTY